MDRTNCSAGFASDRVFIYGDDFVPGQCDVSVAFYVAFFSVLCIIRGILVWLQLRIWRYRNTKARERGVNRRNSRIPMMPLMALVSFAVLVLFTVLSSLNIANAENGVPGFLLGLLYAPVSFAFYFVFEKTVRLGKKLLPLSKFAAIETEHTEFSQRLANLSQLPIMINGTWLVFVTASLVAFASFTAGLFRPVYATFQVGAVCYAVMDVLLPIGMVTQYQRLILATKECKMLAQGEAKSNLFVLDQAIRRMRATQWFYLLGPLMAVIWLVPAVGATLPRYWFAMVYFALEGFTALITTFINMPHAWFGQSKSASSNDATGAASPLRTPLTAFVSMPRIDGQSAKVESAVKEPRDE